MSSLQTLNHWHKTRAGMLVFGLVELVLAYLLGSLAINSGSIWEWVLTALLLLGVAQNFVKLIGTFVHGYKH